MLSKKTKGRLFEIAGLAIATGPVIAGGPLFHQTCNDPSGYMLLCSVAGAVGVVIALTGAMISNPAYRDALKQRLHEWSS